MNDIYKEKARFVKKLQQFYIDDCKNPETIKRLDYVYDEESENEFIYVSFRTHSQKRIYVAGRNQQGMLMDFTRFLANMDSFYWLMSADPAFRAEFLEDE